MMMMMMTRNGCRMGGCSCSLPVSQFSPKIVDTVPSDSTRRVSVSVGMRKITHHNFTPDSGRFNRLTDFFVVVGLFLRGFGGDEISPDPVKFGAFPSAVSLAASPAAKSVRRFPSVRPES